MSDTQTLTSNGYTPVAIEQFGSETFDEPQEQTVRIQPSSLGEMTSRGVNIDAIYQSGEWVSRRLETALRLLRHAEDHLQFAQTEARAGHRAMADDSFYAVKALLPELFCCRAIAEGFATLIGALLYSIENLKGQEVTEEQRATIHSCIAFLRSRPFLDEQSADGQVELLEKSGLNPDPPGLNDLMQVLIDGDE